MRAAGPLSLLAILLSAASAQSSPPRAPVRPLDLVAKGGIYAGRQVDVDIVEPVDQARTPEALAASTYGGIHVQIPEALGTQLVLVPAAYAADDPKRFQKKFDRILPWPLRLHGEFLSDDEMAEFMHRPYWVVRVSHVEPLPLDPPARIASLAELVADRTRWDRKQVIYEGNYRQGFEVLALDGKIWLERGDGAVMIGKSTAAATGYGTDRVRATGILYAHPGAHYGHLNGYDFQLIASKLEYLGKAASQ